MVAFLSILAALIVLLLPGLAYQAWFSRPETDPIASLADAAGLSLSLTALVGLLFNLLGVAPGGYGAAFLYGLCLVALLVAWLVRGFPRPGSSGWLRPALHLLLGLAALGGIIFFRFYQARDLAFPNWTDSVQHTLIVRIILEHGGLPSDLLPYLNAPFSYHYGFHLAAAAFAFWSHLAPDQAVLIFGNLINALVSLAIYRLGRSTGMGVRASALAGLLSGLALQMPAYYLTWGRYTLLAGLVLLCLAMAAALDFTRKSPDWRSGLRLLLLTTGVCLTHYLATLLLLFFFLVIGAAGLIHAYTQHDARKIPWKLAGYAAVGGLIALPWLVRVLGDFSSQATIGEVKTALKLSDWNYLIYLLGPRHNYYLLAFAALGLIFAFRLPRLRSFCAWTMILLLLAQPFTPQIGPFRPDLYVIVLFLPAALLLADLLVSGADALGRRAGAWAGVAGLLVAGASAAGLGGARDAQCGQPGHGDRQPGRPPGPGMGREEHASPGAFLHQCRPLAGEYLPRGGWRLLAPAVHRASQHRPAHPLRLAASSRPCSRSTPGTSKPPS